MRELARMEIGFGAVVMWRKGRRLWFSPAVAQRLFKGPKPGVL
jgi:hypothetical protein